MDSISQFVLGASVGLAISPIKTKKVALISGLLATVPDLDVFINYGNDMFNLINHRGFSHSIFTLSLASLLFAKLLQKVFNPKLSYKRCLAICLGVLLTHVILDSFTIFGTQLFWPLKVDSVMIGSIFIVDLFYTTPLLISFIILLFKGRLPIIRKFSINTWALSLSTSYLILSIILQSYVFAANTAPSTNIKDKLAMPTLSNLIIWRIIAIDDNYIYEKFYHIFKNTGKWLKIPHNKQKFKLDNTDIIDKYANFSHDFYRLDSKNNKLIISDMRMGVMSAPLFNFIIANKQNQNNIYQSITPQSVDRLDIQLEHIFGGQSLF